MIGVLLAVGAQVVVKPAEVWEPRVSWGCVVSKEGEKPFVLNGIIAQRNEPNNPNVHQRFERALRVVRDDSGASGDTVEIPTASAAVSAASARSDRWLPIAT